MLVCCSHLRWNFVWQRPQHLFSRFARTMPVLFIEEPEFVLGDEEFDFNVTTYQGVTVCTPLLPRTLVRHGGFNAVTNPIIKRLVAPLCSSLQLRAGSTELSVLWYYTPMALGAEPLGFEADVVVFDAMDELAAFRGAPVALRNQEAALLAAADLVFAGGPSLYEARRHRHPAVSCFPSGVESAHFATAMNGIPRPVDLNNRPRPIIGYYGVIDERVDLGLIAAIADAHPEWTVAMIGPIAKISADDLPQRANIAYYGKQEYSALPGFLACFDIALMPFALNEATRFISPTKTLEYLAAGKPVVSTPIQDVVTLYSSVVKIGDSAEAIIGAIEDFLVEPASTAADRRRKSAAIVADYQWDAIAERMWSQIETASRRGSPRRSTVAAR